jgi:hypothetical protein
MALHHRILISCGILQCLVAQEITVGIFIAVKTSNLTLVLSKCTNSDFILNLNLFAIYTSMFSKLHTIYKVACRIVVSSSLL